MAQAPISFRGDETLKRSFDSVCDQLGLSNSAAYTLFMKAVVRERRIPFEIKIDSDEEIRNKAIQAVARMRKATEESGMVEMSLDEINSIIEEVRNGR
ncbi:MAG: type II toxin-antitoxin system RelB/DinJ family antitoxin [Candidatus Cryptobacteroides sp.]